MKTGSKEASLKSAWVGASDEALANFSWYTGNLSWLRSRTVMITKHGSHAYGTNIATSDLDLKGFAIAPKEYYLGNLHNFEQAEVREPLDCVIYDIKKFWKLATDCNPNIIEVLWTDPADRIPLEGFLIGDVMAEVDRNKHLFLSRKAKHTFSGYAHAQLKRIKTHRKWLLDPPTKKPDREDFGLSNSNPTIGKEQMGVIASRIKKIEDSVAGKGANAADDKRADEVLVSQALGELNLSSGLLYVILNERRYAAAARNWDHYQKWKTERNPDRSALEAQHGYDTKHAMHLVRLMRMAKEILSGKGVIVKRPDAAELLAIRRGEWTFDALMTWADGLDAELEDLYLKSPLPHEPDRVRLDDLLVGILEEAL